MEGFENRQQVSQSLGHLTPMGAKRWISDMYDGVHTLGASS